MKKKKNSIIKIIGLGCLLCLFLVIMSGCGSKEKLVVVSGSENKSLEPIIHDFEKKNNIDVELVYKGSVDMMLEMRTEALTNYDAVWPANSLWISLGDEQKRIKHAESIMTSPVAFGIRKSLAESLGVVDKDIMVEDILTLIRNDELQFMMTSATQSNSGASAYIGFLSALVGEGETLTLADLQNKAVEEGIKDLLSGIHRSSGSSGWLKDLFLQGDYDAMVNYEALLIETNQELIREGREPLYIVYPRDGLAIADSPLGYVNKGDENKEKAFLELQTYLKSDEIQQKIVNLGRRTGIGGMVKSYDKKVFNPEWGIQTDKVISGIRLPEAEVIETALQLYQTSFKKPSLTVYCLDFSGSMYGEGERELKNAMDILLNQDKASQYFLQANSDDITVVIPFSSQILDKVIVKGNDSEKLNELSMKISEYSPKGNTDIFGTVITALQDIETFDNLDTYVPAIVLMTDGESNGRDNYRDLERYYKESGMDIPIFSITFGGADRNELEEIADLTRSRVFDGTKDLIHAFKKARGYN